MAQQLSSAEPDVSSDRFQININYSGSPLNTNIFDYGNISTGRLTSLQALLYSTLGNTMFL